MGSGESDAVKHRADYYVQVTPYTENTAASQSSTSTVKLTNTTGGNYNANTVWDTHYCGSWCNHQTTWYYPYYSPVTIYKYQITCPKRSCKTMNWLELDKITPCTKCGSKLKAVSEAVDFEVPVVR
jgi:hypothetical protein